MWGGVWAGGARDTRGLPLHGLAAANWGVALKCTRPGWGGGARDGRASGVAPRRTRKKKAQFLSFVASVFFCRRHFRRRTSPQNPGIPATGMRCAAHRAALRLMSSPGRTAGDATRVPRPVTVACLSSAAADAAPTHRVPHRVAVAQLSSTADLDANYDAVASAAAAAVTAGASILFLPECFAFLGRSGADTIAAATPLDGDGSGLTRYRDLARSTGLWLFCGGFAEAGAPGGRVFNSFVALNSDGATAAVYRKTHLFDAESLRESASTAPGDALVTVDAPCGRVGLTVCYDLRFSALYDALAFQHGCRILAIPAAFTIPTGQAHWEVLLRARAVETQCAVVAAAQVGPHNDKRASYGHSLIVDAWGRVLVDAGGDAAGGIVVADLDDAAVEAVRRRMPIAQHRAAGRRALGWPA